ncbi:MAG: endoglucanase [Proteobacteria bacterium]|jgi:endoglucanase|nr:MAG: endoglucanase [Pseudomonadota bacterium]
MAGHRPILASPVTRRHVAAMIAAGLVPFPAVSRARSAEAAALPPALARGFNLPGWTDHEQGIAPARAVLERLHALGFSSIRLPVAADPLLGDREAARAMLRRIGDAIALSIAAGFAVVLDLHPAGAFAARLREDISEGARLAIAAWTLLRDVVANFPDDKVYAELLNEPPLEQADWMRLRDELARVIRHACPRHGIVWGPARYQGLWELAQTTPLADARAIVAVHYYWPMGFTHQCANWDGSALGRISGLPFPAAEDTPAVARLRQNLETAGDREALAMLEDAFSQPWSAERIAADFRMLGEWARAQNCPVVVGEFGVLDFCVDPQSRANWVRAVRQAAEANGIGWTYWELDQGFGFIRSRLDTEGFNLSMVEALTGGGA